jgi:hypothetical protein
LLINEVIEWLFLELHFVSIVIINFIRVLITSLHFYPFQAAPASVELAGTSSTAALPSTTRTWWCSSWPNWATKCDRKNPNNICSLHAMYNWIFWKFNISGSKLNVSFVFKLFFIEIKLSFKGLSWITVRIVSLCWM